MTCDMSQVTETNTSNESSDSMLGEKSRGRIKSSDNIQSSLITKDASTRNESPKTSPRKTALTREPLEESPDSSWGEAAQKLLLESERTGKMHQKTSKYIPLEPLEESPDSSWAEAAQRILFESELTGKGYQQPNKSQVEVENELKTTTKRTKEVTKDPIFKKVGFVNWKRDLSGRRGRMQRAGKGRGEEGDNSTV